PPPAGSVWLCGAPPAAQPPLPPEHCDRRTRMKLTTVKRLALGALVGLSLTGSSLAMVAAGTASASSVDGHAPASADEGQASGPAGCYFGWRDKAGRGVCEMESGSLATRSADDAAAATTNPTASAQQVDETVCYRSGRYWICWYE